jgi:hypothetical protein
MDAVNTLALCELTPDTLSIINIAKEQLREHFKQRRSEITAQRVDRWKKENIYPYEDSIPKNSVEEVERKVFDILAINVENKLPSFSEANFKAQKLTFCLLAQAIQSNPNSVLQIINEVLDLKKSEQDELAKLLTRTSLSSVIKLGKIVTNRLDFLQGLDDLLFHSETKKTLYDYLVASAGKICDNGCKFGNEGGSYAAGRNEFH